MFPLASSDSERGLLGPLFSQPFLCRWIGEIKRKPRLTASVPVPQAHQAAFPLRPSAACALSQERPRPSCKLHTDGLSTTRRKPQEIASV